MPIVSIRACGSGDRDNVDPTCHGRRDERRTTLFEQDRGPFSRSTQLVQLTSLIRYVGDDLALPAERGYRN